MKVGITAIGTANPAYKRTQEEAAELVAASLHLAPKQKRVLKSIYKATGIAHRYSVIEDYVKTIGNFNFFPNTVDENFPSTDARMVIYKDNALALSLAAITDCLQKLPESAQTEITHVITVSCTGMYAPGLDIELVQQLHLQSSVKRTCIQFMGCYGAFNALRLADTICRADNSARVLVVCVELCTLHFQKKFDVTNMVANAIFADGAAAAIVQAITTEQNHLGFNSFYCDLMPQSSNEMAWTISDSGFDIVLSSYVPEVIKTGIKAFTQKLLQQADFTKIDRYAIHPGGLKILEACEESLGITKVDNKASYNILRDFGNMSSATILFVLKNLWQTLQEKDDHQNIFACAFGPGLTLESAMLTYHH